MLIDPERESCATFPFAYILLELSLCESLFAFPPCHQRRSASKKEKLAVIGATQYNYCKAKKGIFRGGLK